MTVEIISGRNKQYIVVTDLNIDSYLFTDFTSINSKMQVYSYVWKK